MRIVLFCLVMIVLSGCGKKEEGPYRSYKDTKVTVLDFEKLDSVAPLETNRTSLRATVHRDQNRILIWVSNSTNERKIKYPIYFFVDIDNQSYFFETKTNKDGFLLASIPYEYIDKEISINIQFYDQFIHYKTTPSTPNHCRYHSTIQYVKSNKPVYTPEDPIIVHSLAQSYRKGKLYKCNSLDTFTLLITSLEEDTVYKNNFTMNKWASHYDTISPEKFTVEGTYVITLFNALQYEQIQAELKKWNKENCYQWNKENCYHRHESATQTIFVQKRIQSPMKLQIMLSDTVVTEEEGIQYSLSLSGVPHNKETEVTLRYYFIDKIPHPLNGIRGDVFGAAFYNHQQLELEKKYTLDNSKNKTIFEKLPFHNDYQEIIIEASAHDSKERFSIEKQKLVGIKKKSQLVIQTEFDVNQWHDTINTFMQPFSDKAVLPNTPITVNLSYDSITNTDTTIMTNHEGIAHLSFVADSCNSLQIKANTKNIKQQINCYIDRNWDTSHSCFQVTFDKKYYNWEDTAIITLNFTKKPYESISQLHEVTYVHQGQDLIDFGKVNFKNNRAELKCVIKKKNGIHQALFIDGWLAGKIPLSGQLQQLKVSRDYQKTALPNDTLRGTLTFFDSKNKTCQSNFSVNLMNVKQIHLTNQLNHQMQNPINPKSYSYAKTSSWKEQLSFPPMAFYGIRVSNNSKLISMPPTSLKKKEKSRTKTRATRRRVSKGEIRDNFRYFWPFWMSNRKCYSLYSPNCSPFPVYDMTFNEPFAYSLTEEENYSYFNPNITTDENGEAEISIPLPNIEGEWILRAIGSDDAGHLIDFTDTIVTKNF